MGWTVTDMWLLQRSSKEDPGKQDKRQIVEFAGDLSESLFEMAMEMEAAGDAAPSNQTVVVTVEISESMLRSLTGNSNNHKHTKEYLAYTGSKSTTRSGQRVASQAHYLWCSRTLGKTRKTQVRCVQCGVEFCNAKTGQKCWQNHVLNNGLPPKPQQRRKKRSRVCQVVNNNVSNGE